MAKKARPKKKGAFRQAHRATANARRAKRKSSNPQTRVIVVGGKQNRRGGKVMNFRPRKKNPTFFGSNVNAMQIAEYIAGGLIGVTINRAILPMLPAAVTQNNLAATAAAFAIAAAEWWVFSFVSKEFGAAVGFGGFMSAGSQALNTFIPSVGAVVGLSGRGRRGVGNLSDFVNGSFTVPQNPVLDANSGMVSGPGLMHTAYPLPYGRAA